MKNQLTALRAGFAFAVIAGTCASVQAVGVTNGSLTGPIANGGVPPGWTLLLGSPDTNDVDHNVGGGTPFGIAPSGPSPDGGTWVGMGADIGFVERFGQDITGLTVGQTYTVSWYAGNFGAQTGGGYLGTNAIQVLLDGGASGHGDFLALGADWYAQSLNFTATASSMFLAFQLETSEKAYLSIDGISVGAVPEPSTYALMFAGIAAIGHVVRRRRSLS